MGKVGGPLWRYFRKCGHFGACLVILAGDLAVLLVSWQSLCLFAVLSVGFAVVLVGSAVVGCFVIAVGIAIVGVGLR